LRLHFLESRDGHRGEKADDHKKVEPASPAIAATAGSEERKKVGGRIAACFEGKLVIPQGKQVLHLLRERGIG
jgi:hypothetical protein